MHRVLAINIPVIRYDISMNNYITYRHVFNSYKIFLTFGIVDSLRRYYLSYLEIASALTLYQGHEVNVKSRRTCITFVMRIDHD